MARQIIIKTVGGRKYRYERVSTKREGGKVVTKDKYIGPVAAAGGKIEQASAKTRRHIEALYAAGYPIKHVVERLQTLEGIKISGSTIRNYMKREGITRLPYWAEERSKSAKEGWEKRQQKKAAKQRTARGRAKMMMEDDAITAADAMAMMSGDIDEGIVRLLWGKETKKRAAARKND